MVSGVVKHSLFFFNGLVEVKDTDHAVLVILGWGDDSAMFCVDLTKLLNDCWLHFKVNLSSILWGTQCKSLNIV